MNTPWGESQHIENIAKGIQHVDTAGHGGIKLSVDMNEKIPITWRQASFNGQGMRGWYEHDCDIVMVVLTFPEHFPDANMDEAKATMHNYYNEVYDG